MGTKTGWLGTMSDQAQPDCPGPCSSITAKPTESAMSPLATAAVASPSAPSFLFFLPKENATVIHVLRPFCRFNHGRCWRLSVATPIVAVKFARILTPLYRTYLPKMLGVRSKMRESTRLPAAHRRQVRAQSRQ